MGQKLKMRFEIHTNTRAHNNTLLAMYLLWEEEIAMLKQQKEERPLTIGFAFRNQRWHGTTN